MRVIVCGSRGYAHLQLVRERVRELPPGTVLIVGGARGPDLAAERVGHEQGLTVRLFLPDWKTHGRSAGHRRNAAMLADLLAGDDDDRLVVAFHDGASKGTAGMVAAARRAGVEVEYWNANGERE